MSNYNLRNIRYLLTEGFTDMELRQLCYDTPEFRPVYDQLGEKTGKAEIIHRLLEHADRKELFTPLLAWAKAQSPAKYEKHQPYHTGPTPISHGKLHNVPELPPHFFPRPADLAEVKAVLLTVDKPVAITGATRKVGLQGMGGIGKSVLAAALAHDDEVQQAFPGGVFWLTLGRDPALTTRQSQLAESLGDPIRIFGDAQQGRARLSELLAGQTCLLILDDIWDVAHAEAFNALGPEGRLLLTSRDAGVIRALGAREHRLDVLGKPQALALLAQWADQPVSGLLPEANIIAKECGYLPLALAMIGAQLKGHPDRWANVLHKLQQADLAKIQQQFPHYPYPNLLRALQVSVEALEPEAQVHYLELAVFREDAPVPEAALQTYWASAGLNEYDVQDLMDMWVDRSLARRDNQGRLSLHDLQYDYVRQQAGQLTGLHKRLVEAYRRICSNGWTGGPDDGYFFEHLAYHLAEAGQREALYALISKKWMDAQFKRTFSDYAFADDVERVIAVAGAEEPPNLVQVIRGCLIYATLGEWATNVPPEILGVLAQVGQVERALKYAALINDAERCSQAYRRIGEALVGQNEIEAAEIPLNQALLKAEVIEAKGNKAFALNEVVKVLAQMGKLDEALAVMGRIEAGWIKDLALSEVAQALAQIRDFKQALTIAEVIETKWIKVSALSKVTKALAKKRIKNKAIEVVNRALIIAEGIEYEQWKVFALSEVAQALIQINDRDRALEIISRALSVVEAIEVRYKARPLSDVAKVLGQLAETERMAEVVKRAMDAAETIENEIDKVESLIQIAKVLAEVEDRDRAVEAINLALAVVEAIDSDWYKAKLFSKVAEAMAQAGAIERATELANRVLMMVVIGRELEKTSVLSSIAKALTQVGQYNRAGIIEEILRKIGNRNIVGEVVDLPNQKKSEAIHLTNKIFELLKDIKLIEDKLLKDSLLYEIVQILIRLENITHVLTETEANKIFELLKDIKLIEDKEKLLKDSLLYEIVQILIRLENIDHALAEAEAIEDRSYKAKALSKVTNALIPLVQAGYNDKAVEVVSRMLQKIESVEDEWGKAHFLIQMAQALVQAREFDRALVMMDVIKDTNYKAYALSRLSQALVKVGNREKAVEVANQALAIETIEDDEIRSFTLSEVALTLAWAGNNIRAVEVANQALIMIELVTISKHNKASVMHKVAQVMGCVGQSNQAWYILRHLFTKSRLLNRKSIFDVLEHGAIALANLDQGETLWKVYKAVMEVEEWWGSGRMKGEA